MIAIDFEKMPWKHPAVWTAHVVKMTRAADAGSDVSVATCECGWSNRVNLNRTGAGHIEQDDAVNAHWKDVIAAAAKSSP